MELPKAYNPKIVEDKIYKLWEKSGFFNPDKTLNKKKESFCIVIPPPNVTGELHIGHALNAVIHDILIRQKRMQGFKTLWLPGTDHAGIATQNVVEKELKKEGKTRFDLGRELFIKRVWKWKEKYGNIILDQLKKTGASCDWSRTRFTMDKEYSEAVKAAFLHYFEKGWIYRGKKVVNWCPRCQTSLSDLELEHKEEKGKLWYIKYKIKEQRTKNKEQYITVATTRPETMLGDTAVAVNPKDKRYKDLVGKKAILPLVGREIPIIADRAIDPEFGTGALKVTPAHSLIDYELGLKHKLESIQIIDKNAKIVKDVPAPYQGLKVLEARKKVVEDLKNQGLLEKIEDYVHQIPKCYRCDTTIELIPSWQWFLKMKELAKIAEEPVRKGEIKFYPKNFEKPYFDWLKNIRDWCISRQIWWGHRIPVWYCQDSEEKIKNTICKMGFAGDVVPQVFNNKTRTYRLRDHDIKVGDRVAFENSATGEIFGTAIITEAKKTTVGKINLKDKKHWKIYNKLEELIVAFKRHHPEKEVIADTPAWIYTYKFENACPPIKYTTKKCPHCNGEKLRQEQDVLDTWFSSALWPFATLGWPEKTNDLKTFYPTNILITARDILNLWVARMIFSGAEFMKKIPFKQIIIHATVLTKEGKRMSKSLGTGIDPMNLIEKYGADATRFGITYQIMGGQDIKFVEDNIIMGKKFCNKIWNASRFILMNKPPLINADLNADKTLIENLTAADKRILKILDTTIKLVNRDLEKFQFGQAAHKLYDFFWHDFCDKYIEESKGQKTENKVLFYVLLTSLKLLHPFIPFITEEIYQKLPIKNKKKCLMVEEWPK